MRLLRSAFTLVEVMLVTVLVAGIALAVFSCLTNGIRLWDRSRVLMIEEDAAFFFDRFSSDLRNSFSFSTLDFSGREQELSFPTVVLTKADSAGSRAREGYTDGLGMVQYSFYPATGELLRRQANYAQARRGSFAEPRTLVQGLKSARFRYLSAADADYKLSQEPGGPIPAGVELELSFMNGTEERTLRRFVPVPAGLK
ncbi:MAG: hypothetical protein HQL20_01430 [Candidatus Omnitrophica bacterium]|nr:hypothetical protein [Candidatus Omnitrophota bacterium]